MSPQDGQDADSTTFDSDDATREGGGLNEPRQSRHVPTSSSSALGGPKLDDVAANLSKYSSKHRPQVSRPSMSDCINCQNAGPAATLVYAFSASDSGSFILWKVHESSVACSK